MSRARDAVISTLVLLLGRGRRPPRQDVLRIVPARPQNPAAEIVVLLLLGLGALCAVAFVCVYALAKDLPAENQLLGICLGLSLLCLAAGLYVVALKLVVTEEIVEEYPAPEHPYEQQVLVDVVEESGSRFSRLGLFKLGLLGAGSALGLALVTPAVSWGPIFRIGDFLGTPWRRGRRLVDPDGKPYRASDIELDNFYDAFPEGVSEQEKEQMAAPVLLIRLPASALRLPPHLQDYPADGGVLAYSKICTHAGCAIELYRAPLFPPVEPGPALVCPCHYSTFDPANGGQVLFGPAGRDLPMLPIETDARGFLRAKGGFDGPVGPSWWGVRMYPQHPHPQ
jgi:ubiquinol-cytochrome c reductase iron-sulfur subunit